MHATIRILRNEHFALVGLLRTLLLMLEQSRATGRAPDFGALRAMLFYVAEFPEKRHHRKESELLFPKLRARTPLARTALDRLEEDHARGEAKVRELAHALTAFELLGEPRREPFELGARAYVDFYLGHMALEEREILPLAERVLTPEDWADLDEAMCLDPDPLTGARPEAGYEALFERIVLRVPAPLGLGDPAPGRPGP